MVNNFDREFLTAVNLARLQSDDSPAEPSERLDLEPEQQEIGEASLVALRAVLVGLISTLPALPSAMSEFAIVGLTLTAARNQLEVSHDPMGADPKLLDRALRLLNEDWPPQGNILALGVDGWVFASPARDAAGGLVGALVVLVSPPPADETAIEAGDDQLSDLLEGIAAGVEVGSDAYARLLVDLLGEHPAGQAGQ